MKLKLSFFAFNCRFNYFGFILSIVLLSLTSLNVLSQSPVVPAAKLSPEVLPGNGLSKFDFFYAGEAKEENMYIIKNGKIAWSYSHPVPKGEISDAVLLSNMNVLFAHQFGVTEISADKKVVWNYDAPEGFEIHTAQPIGLDKVIFIMNGNPAKAIIMKKSTNEVIKEIALLVGNATSTHGQFRHARLSDKGTYVVAQMDMGKVCEYDSNGKVLLTIDAPGVWSAEPLKNGNILITTRDYVREINRKLETVWEYTLNNIPDYSFKMPQVALRLSNGNTIINNWFNLWNGPVDAENATVQAIEVTPDKKIIWALREWSEPVNLGPSTIIIPLSEPRTNENAFFGDIK